MFFSFGSWFNCADQRTYWNLSLIIQLIDSMNYATYLHGSTAAIVKKRWWIWVAMPIRTPQSLAKQSGIHVIWVQPIKGSNLLISKKFHDMANAHHFVRFVHFVHFAYCLWWVLRIMHSDFQVGLNWGPIAMPKECNSICSQRGVALVSFVCICYTLAAVLHCILSMCQQ